MRHYQAYLTDADFSNYEHFIKSSNINSLSGFIACTQSGIPAVGISNTHGDDLLEKFLFNFMLTVSFPCWSVYE